ncbi:MAG: hypothetical protein ACR2J6_05400 [Thermoleophilaceae bacterium]
MEAATVPEQAAGAAPFEGRARQALKRRRGVVPNDLRQRIDRATNDFHMKSAARFIAAELDGLHPSALTDGERQELREAWRPELADPVLQLLDQVGYGAPPARRARAERAHGLRRETRLKGVLGKLPRSLALRLPTSANTHRTGRNDGTDRWGTVKCSLTLRPDHLGLIAAACGLWHSRAGDDAGYVDVTGGELVQLLTGRRRVGGKDVVWVHGLLADLEALEISADVRDRRSPEPSGPSDAHPIPSSPIERVERRVGDRWVAADAYADALAAAAKDGGADLLELHAAEHGDCPGIATIRIHLAAWVRDELAHSKRRPVFVNFDVWAHLRPQARRTYAFVQGHGRDDYDGRVYFYLASPTLFTLGLSGQRPDRTALIVSHDLTALWHADCRYHEGEGFARRTHAGTSIPAFACDPARRASSPTAKAMTTKSPPKRPGDLRGAVARLRRHSILAARGVSPDQLDGQHVRRVGLEAAKREADLVRQTIQRSLGEAAAASRDAGPFEPSKAAAQRRQQGRADADDDPAAD